MSKIQKVHTFSHQNVMFGTVNHPGDNEQNSEIPEGD